MFLETNKKKDIENNLSLSDEKIIGSTRNQPQLFEIIVNRYQDAFVRKAMLIVKRKEDAEDIVQETFVKIFLHTDKFKIQEGASFRSWGYKILINTCFTHYKKLQQYKSRFCQLDPELEEILPDKNAVFEQYTLSEYILCVMSKMPANLRKVLDDYFIKGISQKELARQEALSVSAIKIRIYRAKKIFKKISNSFVL